MRKHIVVLYSYSKHKLILFYLFLFLLFSSVWLCWFWICDGGSTTMLLFYLLYFSFFCRSKNTSVCMSHVCTLTFTYAIFMHYASVICHVYVGWLFYWRMSRVCVICIMCVCLSLPFFLFLTLETFETLYYQFFLILILTACTTHTHYQLF